MTATAPAATPTRVRPGHRALALLAAAFFASGVLLALAEWQAARGGGSAHYYLFWLGYLAAAAPAAWLLVRDATNGATRGALVVALGFWSLVPTLLRTGGTPLFFDEFSHLRMLQDLVHTGHPVSSTGLLQIGASFPGLELVTSGLYHLSGLSLWLAALTVAGVAHVALLAGVYVLVRDAARSPRAGAIAAVAYSLNPSWLFFDAQFSYETLALPMLVWSLVFALRGTAVRHGTATRRARGTQLALAVLLSGGLVVTHHVTSVVNCAALIGIAVVATVQRRGVLRGATETSALAAWLLAAWAVVLTTWRFVDVGHPLLVYLGPTFHLSQQLRQLLSLLGLGAGLPAHSAFASSSAPFFEVACAYLMLPVLLVAFVWAVWGLASVRRTLTPLAYVMVLLGALFFVSLPLASAAAYSESVHRSWAYSFLGLAVVLGLAGAAALDGRLSITFRHRGLWPPPARAHRSLRPIVAACALVVAIGGVSVGTSTSYRFGGPVAPETDPLYVGTQTAMLAQWFAHNTTAHDVVFGDRYVVRPIAIASPVRIAKPGGSEALLFLTRTVPARAVGAYLRDRVTYVVVNRHLGDVGTALAWTWFVSSDALLPPDARTHGYPWHLGCLNWANAVFATSDYEVLKVEPARLAADVRRQTNGLVANCGPGTTRGPS